MFKKRSGRLFLQSQREEMYTSKLHKNKVVQVFNKSAEVCLTIALAGG